MALYMRDIFSHLKDSLWWEVSIKKEYLVFAQGFFARDILLSLSEWVNRLELQG